MKLVKFSIYILTSALALTGSSQLFAQSKIVVKLPINSQSVSTNVPAQSSNGTELVFYSVVKGNVTSQIGVEILGPKGLETSVEASQIKGSAEDTLEKGKFWKIYLSGSLVESSKKAAVKLAAAQLAPGSAIRLRSVPSGCAALPPAIISSILDALSKQQGRPVSFEEFCPSGAGQTNPPGLDSGDEGVTIPNNNSPKIIQNFGTAHGFLEKDNCSAIKNYLVRVTVKLTKVSADDLSKGFDVKARLQEFEYNGSRAASLKPVSDGKYAPRPLLLMSSLGGGQWVNLVSWKNGIPKILTKVPATPSIAFHRGLLLIRIIADKLLAGGRGEKINFELTNGSSVYNVCGPRARKRWRVNGYPS